VDPLVVFSPAKINLFLAVTGRRADGFHDLVSVVAPLDFGDTLAFHPTDSGCFELRCDRPELAVDDSNLVLRAARAFATRTGWRGGVRIELEKRIPIGAGLGGGSSNAVATLLALNRLASEPLDRATLAEVAAELGSDCPLFLSGGPVVMRGRGETIEPLPESAIRRLAGRRLLLFKPAFAINTAWAYQRLAAEAAAEKAGASEGVPVYLPSRDAEARLANWVQDEKAPPELLLFNSLERPAFGKFVALPCLLDQLQREHGWFARMSGSGSACFGFVTEEQSLHPLTNTIRAAWGDTAFVASARIPVPAERR
jgi:4-diphosphocytidyl-2-C-methyl-D-erythritol kinase